MASTRYQFAILGGGPAGLGAAYRLAQRGFDVVLLERGRAVGGLASSFEFMGLQVDHGSHRLHPTTPVKILEVLRSELGEDLQLRRRHGRIRLADRWLAFPLQSTDLARNLPPSLLLRMGISGIAATLRPTRDDTYRAYVTTGLGRAMGEAFYFPYARKIWGAEPSELSGVQARRRISASSPLKLARRIFAGGRSTGSSFYYPARGFGQISAGLSRAAQSAGAVVRTDAEVARIAYQGGRWRIAATDGSQIAAEEVWSTLPIPRLHQLAGASSPAPTLTIPALRYRAMILVYLGLNQPRYTEFDAHYFPEAEVPITRVSEPKNYRDGPDPANSTVLCAEWPCAVTDEVWRWPDERLKGLVATSLARYGLPSVAPSAVLVRRIPFAYPVYATNYDQALQPLLAWVAEQPRLITFGRQGLFAHDNTHHALAMAWAAASAVGEDGRLDEQRWANSLQAFQRHVVED